MLEIDAQTVKDHMRTFVSQDGSSMPRGAVAALLALDRNPSAFLVWRVPHGEGTRWSALSLGSIGLTVVYATSESDPDWTWTLGHDPADARIEAQLHPLRAIRSVGVLDLTLHNESVIRTAELRARLTWQISFTDDAAAIELPYRPFSDWGENTPDTFCAALLQRLAGA